MMMLHEI
jgi:hypothetical protein